MTVWDARQSGIPVLRILDQVWNDWPGWRGFAGLGRCGTSFSPCSQCQALGQALVLCYQGRGGFCRLVWTCSPESPCRPVNSPLREHDGRFCKGVHQGRGGCCRLVGLVHPRHPAALWIPAYAGMTGTAQYDGPGGRFVLFHPHL